MHLNILASFIKFYLLIGKGLTVMTAILEGVFVDKSNEVTQADDVS